MPQRRRIGRRGKAVRGGQQDLLAAHLQRLGAERSSAIMGGGQRMPYTPGNQMGYEEILNMISRGMPEWSQLPLITGAGAPRVPPFPPMNQLQGGQYPYLTHRRRRVPFSPRYF